MIEELKKIANRFINLYENNPKELEKYKIIAEMLNDKKLFSNIEIEFAYSILRDLKIPENELRNVYVKLLNNK